MMIFQIFLSGLLYPLTKQQEEFQFRIAYGDLIENHIIPYQAGLAVYHGNKKMEMCGGALISTQHVLTALHCLRSLETEKDATGVTIFLGSDTFVSNTSLFCQKCWTTYPGFEESNGHDIAIITLPKEVEFSENIKPIKLPSKSEKNLDLIGKIATVSGYGYTEANNISVQLRSASVVISDPSQCKELWWFSPEDICVKVEDGKSTCVGDSGGPMVFHDKLVGIVSRGDSEICSNVTTVAYTKVSQYLDWIASVTGIKIDN